LTAIWPPDGRLKSHFPAGAVACFAVGPSEAERLALSGDPVDQACGRKDGLEMLNTAATKSLELANDGCYFPLEQLNNYHLPYPALWSAETVSTEIVQAWRLSKQALDELLKENNLTRADVGGDQMTLAVKRQYVHNGEDFLNVETDIGPMNIRWESVIGYACPPP
jgi:hypothetical protein